MNSGPRILVIRRDNIGDLVCTTPLIHALRERFPEGYLCALVNSYNLPVLENNPDLNELFAYTKAKHRPKGKSVLGIYWDRLRLMARLRHIGFDYAILAAPGFQPRALRLARAINAKHVIGFTEPGKKGAALIDMPVPYSSSSPMHEAEDVFRVLAPLAIEGTPPLVRVFPEAREMAGARARLASQGWPKPAMLVGLHISARKLSQRWPAQRFIELAQRLHRDYRAAFMLFWSPGDSSNPLHPGDDAKAEEIVKALEGIPVLAYPSAELRQLIAGLALCDRVVCGDGGAMHIAAGLDKPIVCFFGNSNRIRWHPWGVPHVLLQPEGKDVMDVSVDQAASAFRRLLAEE